MRKMENIDVKIYAIKKGVKHWEIADKLGIYDSNFSRMLRKELSTEQKERIKGIIDEIAKEREAAYE